MASHRVRRRGAIDLVFKGELLAEESTYVKGATRWQEIRIFKTDKGRYVVQSVGRSEVPGERDLINIADVFDAAPDVVEALYRTAEGGRRYITNTALDALDAAGAKDPALAEAAVEWA